MAVFCSQVAPDPALKKPPSCGPSCIGGSTGGHTWSSGHQSYFNHITTWGYDDICKHGDMTICTFRSLNGHHVKRAQGNIKVWWFSVMLLLGKKIHPLALQIFIFSTPHVGITSILHICHNHHNRWLCKNIQSSVKFANGYVKETALILNKMCSFTKSV